MMHHGCKNGNNFNQSKLQVIEKMLHWTLVIIMVFQQLKTTAAAKYSDTCMTKNQAGICKGWGECPIMKTLIESGEYSIREVINCGFDIREELICCPIRAEMKNGSDDSDNDRFGNHTATTTATEAPAKDFWLDLLQNTTSTTSTTAAPDFWLDLLTTTTSTTPKPLIIGNQKLNESSKFFDFSTLLGGNKAQSETILVENQPSNNANNFNRVPLDINPGILNQVAPNFPNDRGNSGQSPQFTNNGHMNMDFGRQNNGWGQSDFRRVFNRGRGPHNHFNNGRGPHNNIGGIQNIWNQENLFQGVAFPQNNIRPSHSFGQQNYNSNHRPVGHVSSLQEQHPVSPVLNTDNRPTNGVVQTNNNNKKNDTGVDDLISHIFFNSELGQDDPKSKYPFFNTPTNLDGPQPVVWLTPQNNDNNNHKVQFVQTPTSSHQPESQNPQVAGQFEITPVAANLMNGNDLEEVPSTNFITQPALVNTWPQPAFNPIQVIHENLANSGLEIVNGQETVFQPIPNHQPSQVFLIQSQMPIQQPPQMLYPQQHFVDPSESAAKGPRSTAPLPPLLNVQSPPSQALHPFKPFEFRPPPAEENRFSGNHNSLSTNSPNEPNPKPSADRPAVEACRRIESALQGGLTPHILGGTPVEWGEYPHMAAIGYSRVGGDGRPPYDIRCGGTLIDKRFVLTAAHCVAGPESTPSIVRLGVVDFNNANQMKDAVEVRINKTHFPEEYHPGLSYNDIAVLELEREVEYTEYIYPACLYTDLKDPDADVKLWVSGWGTINTTTRSVSDILLKAPLHIAPLDACNQSFVDNILNRRLPQGIKRTQLCAEDKDQIKDSCQGDSGGPLILIVDETIKNYRLVGVVSSGISCASSTPGLYTRVAAFLDFIEKIVWPRKGN